MKIIHLKSFVTVVNLGSFTKAADRLNLSQPAISGHIRSLEEEFGIFLFERGYRTIRPTENAYELLPRAEALLREADGLISRAKELSETRRRSMKIGFVVGMETVRMTPLLGRLAQIMPHVRVDIAQGLSGWVAAEISNGRFDAGFFLGPLTPGDLNALEVDRLKYVLCLPTAWAKKHTKPTMKDLADLPWVWAPQGASYPAIVSAMFASHGLSPRRAIEADRESTIADLLANGLGVGILREPVARAHAAGGKVVLFEDYYAEVPMHFLTRKSADPDIRNLRAVVAELFGVAQNT